MKFFSHNKRNRSLGIAVVIILSSCLSGCKKLIEVNSPVTSINAANVYTTDATAAAVLTGIYTKISSSSFTNGGLTSLSLYPSLSADELTLYYLQGATYLSYYTNLLTSSNTGSPDFWNNIYPIIFIANSAIEGINNSTRLSGAVREQLLGEAKFMRAFCYFYLVNLYRDVPLVLSTDWQVNASITRSSRTQVYQQIIGDLKEAQAKLSANYVEADAITSLSTTERVRPNKWAAAALLARVYLFSEDWVNAEAQASAVIDNSSVYSLPTLDNAFLRNSNEAIWQLQTVGSGTTSNTVEGRLFILPPTGPAFNNPVYLSNNILNSFESGDQRRDSWVASVNPPPGNTTYYYAFKYKIGSVNTSMQEYSMPLRLAEQFLIRAEARAIQNNISGAQDDLNSVRRRAGLPNTSANDKNSLLIAILHERRIELFTEFGHRWLDLKRSGNIDAVMSVVCPQKGGAWNANWEWYPISLTEIQRNSNLTQNQGY